MSVLIKGMEMPKNCAECDISQAYDIRSTWCPLTFSTQTELKRQDNCPLIEVPNPNINSDVLIVGYQVMKKKDGIKYSFLENGLIRMTEVEE